MPDGLVTLGEPVYANALSSLMWKRWMSQTLALYVTLQLGVTQNNGQCGPLQHSVYTN